jgi:hypothetical protein
MLVLGLNRRLAARRSRACWCVRDDLRDHAGIKPIVGAVSPANLRCMSQMMITWHPAPN